MLFCVQHHLMDAGTHKNSTWRKNKKFFSGDQVVGSRDLHTTRSIAQLFLEVVFNVSSHLYVFKPRV